MRRHSLISVVGALVVTLSTVSCDEDDLVDVRGSGHVITETREVSGFDEVVLSGFGKVVVDVTGSESLTIEAEDNVMPLLTSRVVSGRLELGAEQNRFQRLSPTRDVLFRITATELVGVAVRGSGDVTVSGLRTDSFSVSISGSGNVAPVGTCDVLGVEISGSGDFDGRDLTARAGSVSVAGSGNAVVHATAELNVSVSGSGNVEYIGSPSLEQSISGSGEVKPY